MREPTYIPPGTIIKRYGPSVRTYTATEMDELLRGESLPNRYRNVNGLILPVTYDSEPIRD